jgi:hypothetical protein
MRSRGGSGEEEPGEQRARGAGTVRGGRAGARTACLSRPPVHGAVERDGQGFRFLGRQVRGPAPVRRVARDVLPGPGRGGRRDGQRPLRRPGGPLHRAGGRPGPDGGRRHLVHGRGLRRPPEPGGQRRVRAARRLPLETSARLHRRPVPRGGAGHAGAVGHARQAGQRRPDASRPRHPRRHRAGVGGGADHRAYQRDPRHRVRRPAARAAGGARRRQLYRARRAVGGAGQRRVDEPGPVAGPRPRAERLDRVVGVPGRAPGRRGHRRRLRLRAARRRRRPERNPGGDRNAGHPLASRPHRQPPARVPCPGALPPPAS